MPRLLPTAVLGNFPDVRVAAPQRLDGIGCPITVFEYAMEMVSPVVVHGKMSGMFGWGREEAVDAVAVGAAAAVAGLGPGGGRLERLGADGEGEGEEDAGYEGGGGLGGGVGGRGWELVVGVLLGEDAFDEGKEGVG